MFIKYEKKKARADTNYYAYVNQPSVAVAAYGVIDFNGMLTLLELFHA